MMSKKTRPAARAPELPQSLTTLPRSLVAALPVAAEFMLHINAAANMIPRLEKGLADAQKHGAITLARAYVVLHRLNERVREELDISDTGKVLGPLLKRYATEVLPATFEQAGVPHVNLDEGFRVGVSSKLAASIKSDMKEAAYDWLRNNGLSELIVGTVNASTLSAAAKRELEENNRELPEEFFTVAMMPNTSVTQTKKNGG